MMDDLMITSIWDITQIKGLGLGLKLGIFTHIISFEYIFYHSHIQNVREG
jgi:hypothetical protein